MFIDQTCICYKIILTHTNKVVVEHIKKEKVVVG